MNRVITTIAMLFATMTSWSATPNVALGSVTLPASTNTTMSATAAVCPFCSAIALTFSEQLNSNDIAVVAKLIEIPPFDNDINADFPKAKFEITQVLKGQKFVGEAMVFKTQLVGTYPVGQKFLVMGVDPPNVAWTTPMKASDRVFKYLNDIQTLPEGGPKRLTFFQNYFEDEESVLAFDAYDEFARAPYEDLIAMKDQMDHAKLLGWIKDPETSVTRRRLYFTMLGVCGTAEDAKLLEEFITSGSRKKRAGLDALIACYLTLQGESGVDLIEKTFLADQEADYVDTLAAVSALRFHGTEVDIISKPRIVKAVRHLLDRPKMADMIIPDLARWEDWSVMDRLVKMFKEADDESNWLRVPVVTYLRACPKPEAKAYIEELRKIDPEAVQRADFFLGVGESDDDWDDDAQDEAEVETKESTKIDQPDPQPSDEENKVPQQKLQQNKLSESNSEKPGLQQINPTKDQISTSDSDHETNYVVNKSPLPIRTDSSPSEPVSPELKTNSEAVETFASSNQAAADLEASDQAVLNTEAVAVAIDPKSLNQPIRQPNPSTATFVSTTAESMAAPPAPPVAPVPPTEVAPVAAVTPSLTLSIIFIPMAISGAIFLLLWSIVNGWFERLIF